jgi:hypothetical protein
MAKRQQEAPQVGRVLLLYVDETVDDATPFGAVRKQAFTILTREAPLTASQRLCEKPISQMELHWQCHRPGSSTVQTESEAVGDGTRISPKPVTSPWHAALRWMKDVFSRQQRLAQRPGAEIPSGTILTQLRRHLLNLDNTGNPTSCAGIVTNSGSIGRSANASQLANSLLTIASVIAASATN